MQVQHSSGKFFVTIDGKEAFLRYNETGQNINIYDTFTPQELRGRGIAEILALAAFEYAGKNNCKIIASCPYIADTFLKKHPELASMVEP